jgi:hypothetical protein
LNGLLMSMMVVNMSQKGIEHGHKNRWFERRTMSIARLYMGDWR